MSAIHFGTEADGQPYIHLNNLYPTNPGFRSMWTDLEQAYDKGIKIVLMIGGAGGGYAALFSNYEIAYGQLCEILSNHIISGVDLDIEEEVELDNVRRLIRDIKRDFPDYTISMAPIQRSLQSDIAGMGGFVYKDLINTEEGKLISYFNCQFYEDFSESAYDSVIANGYAPNMIVMGSINGLGSIETVVSLSDKYVEFGGVYSWEYSTTLSPITWAEKMSSAMNGSRQDGMVGFLYGWYRRLIGSLTGC